MDIPLYRNRTLLFLVFFVFVLPVPVEAAVPPPEFQVVTVTGGLSLPTGFAIAPDGRVFVAEKSGTVRLIKNGVLQATPVVMLTDVNDFADRGLEGIALDPNFASNGFLYLAHTFENTPGQQYEGPKTGRIVRLTVVGDTASLASKVVILGTVGGDANRPSCTQFATTSDCIPSDSNTHSMGALRFGPDGKLYATLGDGAGYLSVDPEAYAVQDLNWLGGKLVRINPDGSGVADNPFWNGNANANISKVWSFGHRNSFRFSFRPQDGALFFGDVGWAVWEEINKGVRGANYGWPCREGFVATAYNCAPATASTDPLYVYDHHTSTGSVIGGAFPEAFGPEYAGNYFFGDYSNDVLKRLVLHADDTVASVVDFVTNAGGPVDIQTGPDGNLWYAALNVGELRILKRSSAPPPPPPPPPPSIEGCLLPSSGPGTATPHLESAAIAPLPAVIGHQETISATIRNSGSAAPFNFDLEIYNAAGTQVFQKICEQQVLATGASETYVLPWLAPTVGRYTVKVGLFRPDWSGLFEWADAAINVVVENRAPLPVDPPAFTIATSLSSPTPPVGSIETITADITDTGGAASALVDIEVYSAGTKVGQVFFDNQSFAPGVAKRFQYEFPVPSAGTYSVSVGVFEPGWASLYAWFDRVATFTAGANSASPTAIFGDSLQGDWQNWSWGSIINLADTTQKLDAASMRVGYTSAWGGLFLHTDTPLETTGRSALSFAVAGAGASGQKLQVFLFDATGAQLPIRDIVPYLPQGIEDGVFRTVTIPLADLGATGKAISGVVVQDLSGSASQTVNIDNLQVQ